MRNSGNLHVDERHRTNTSHSVFHENPASTPDSKSRDKQVHDSYLGSCRSAEKLRLEGKIEECSHAPHSDHVEEVRPETVEGTGSKSKVWDVEIVSL